MEQAALTQVSSPKPCDAVVLQPLLQEPQCMGADVRSAHEPLQFV